MPDEGLIGFVGKGQKPRSVAVPRQALEIIRLYLTSNGHDARPETPLIRKEDGAARR